jgi:hypothetical protein
MPLENGIRHFSWVVVMWKIITIAPRTGALSPAVSIAM